MKSYTYAKFHKIVALAAVVMIIIAAIIGESIAVPLLSYADSSTVSAYENQNILDDLDGSTIAGVKFDLADYPYDENGQPKVLNFVEFCYSPYTALQDDFGLYVYVYNPEGYAFDNNSQLNQIELTIGSMDPDTYPLEILNYSTASGYEGLFYKFKVALTDSEISLIFKSVDQTARTYTVVGVELSVGGNVIDYEVGATYTYSGYSLGYGSSTATESSLNCSVDGFDRYINLDVEQTVYYPEGDYYNGEQVQLNSCYFGVPNEYLDNYGILTSVFAEWYEYLTKPILITEDIDIFNVIYSLYGNALSNLDDGNEYLFMGFGNTSTYLWGVGSSSSTLCWSSNDYDNFLEHSGYYVFGNGINDLTIDSEDLGSSLFFENFAAVFYTGSSISYSDYSVNGIDLLDRFLLNSQYLANNGYSLDIFGKYCSYLFEDYIDSVGNTTEHVIGYNNLSITTDDVLKIYTNSTTKKWWQHIFGGYEVVTDYDNVDAIVEVSYTDIENLTESEISALYLINENDAADFKQYVKIANVNDETVYIMRYGCANYSSIPLAQACTAEDDNMVDTLCKDVLKQWANEDYSAYVCKETVYLGFDIISLTFTDDGVDTVIPVVMSPQDVFSDTNTPLEEDYGTGINWKTILMILALVLIVIVCAPILPYVAQVIVWVIMFPFKLISAIVQAVKKSKSGSHRNE